MLASKINKQAIKSDRSTDRQVRKVGMKPNMGDMCEMAGKSAKNGITEGVIWKQILIFFFPILIGHFFNSFIIPWMRW